MTSESSASSFGTSQSILIRSVREDCSKVHNGTPCNSKSKSESVIWVIACFSFYTSSPELTSCHYPHSLFLTNGPWMFLLHSQYTPVSGPLHLLSFYLEHSPPSYGHGQHAHIIQLSVQIWLLQICCSWTCDEKNTHAVFRCRFTSCTLLGFINDNIIYLHLAYKTSIIIISSSPLKWVLQERRELDFFLAVSSAGKSRSGPQ